MDGIKACSCAESSQKTNSWLWYKCLSLITEYVHDITCLKPDEEIIKKFRHKYIEEQILKMNRRIRVSHKNEYIYRYAGENEINTLIHINNINRVFP